MHGVFTQQALHFGVVLSLCKNFKIKNTTEGKVVWIYQNSGICAQKTKNDFT